MANIGLTVGKNITALALLNMQSKPPEGSCKVTNIYYNPATKKVVVEYDDVPVEEEG